MYPYNDGHTLDFSFHNMPSAVEYRLRHIYIKEEAIFGFGLAPVGLQIGFRRMVQWDSLIDRTLRFRLDSGWRE